jgi:hypothetical protein
MATEYQCIKINKATESGPGAVRKYIYKSIEFLAVGKKMHKKNYSRSYHANDSTTML